MKQRNLTLAIALFSCLVFIGVVLLVVYALSSETQFTLTTTFPYYTSQVQTVNTMPELLYAGAALIAPSIFANFILGIVLLASRSERTFQARGLVTATGVLGIIGFLISGLPTMIVAFITFAKLNNELKQNLAPEIIPE